MTYDKTEKNNKNNDKNQNNHLQNLRFFVEISRAIMGVDSFACVDVLFLEKSMQCDCHPRKVSIASLRFKNRTQELDFLEIHMQIWY